MPFLIENSEIMSESDNVQNYYDSILDEDNEYLLNVLDQVDGFVFQFIYNSVDNTYSFPFVSGEMLEIYGISKKALAIDGKRAFNLILEQDREEMQIAVFESIKNLTTWRQDYRLLSPTLGLRWLRGSAKPQRLEDGRTLWNGYVSDITEIKNAETELSKNKERFEFAIDGSDMGVWDWDLEKDTVFYSDKSLEILGKKRGEIDPKEETWNDLVHPEDKELYFKNIKEHFQGLTPYYSNQHRVLTTTGEYKWIQDRGKTTDWDADGNPLRVIGTHVDITKIKENEQTLLERNAVIENHNQRLQNFALIVSHNLRTHSGNLQEILRLIKEADTPEEKKELSSYLNGISEGLSGTIGNLDEIVLSRSKLMDTHKLIFLKEYVDQTIAILRSTIEEKNAVIFNNIPLDIQLNYNAAYMESILHNLISNALKYSHPDRQPQIIISVEIISTRDMTLSVTDNGLGIDLERHGSKLFGMYKTFHRNEDAKGLGLFMTKNQIEDMGDDINVESQMGYGTTFNVVFKNKLP